MMIKYLEGNIFESPAQVIVNTVNTVGVMGKGLALEFKNRYPRMYEKYKIACDNNSLTIGKLMLVSEPDHMVLLFPTKKNWRSPSKISYIEEGLTHFRNVYVDREITSIAFPKLGCGYGSLKWEDVKPIMENYLGDLPIEIYIYLGNCNAVSQEKIKKTWLKDSAKDMTSDGIWNDICSRCTLLPYEFNCENKKLSLNLLGDIVQISSQGLDVELNKTELLLVWENMLDTSIFAHDPKNIEFSTVCLLLYTLGYLSKIKIQNEQKEMIDGFQVNKGLGRAYDMHPKS